MQESFRREGEVGAQRESVWELLGDVYALASFSSRLKDVEPIVQGQEWRLILSDRVGPIELSAPMSVEIVDSSYLELITISAVGQDRGLGTRLNVQASVGCQERGSNSLVVTLEGTYEVIGKVANLSSSIVRRQANSMIDEFWSNFVKYLESGG